MNYQQRNPALFEVADIAFRYRIKKLPGRLVR
jgi:hypothetical protein